MNTEPCKCGKQKHIHELTGSTRVFRECCDCHNHRFCTVTGEAMYTKDKQDHYHEVKFRTDFSDEHYHEFYGKTPSNEKSLSFWLVYYFTPYRV